MIQPTTELDRNFSTDGATACPWADALAILETAETFWLSSVRPDGRPHVATLLAVWLEGAMHIRTGVTERKAKNLAGDPRVVLTTGCNTQTGLDVVVEGEAVRLTDDAMPQRLADAWVAKYGEGWRFTVRDGAFHHGAGAIQDEASKAYVFRIDPTTVIGFSKGDVFSQTHWRF